ncbi:hypothetical protein [Nostoc sp. UHCC 0252]|uniref:hypothetical protein n=1 Tax=Nostoc sp. UHCC 0252 TaxID=3110241 RepID=UPI002B204C46|nr:hypothetical protein [Nostoc sp. UHCC 0252]MEA5603993.1 hypothetical protein [Nostoc sp. UHCC 0252]
MPLCRLEQYKKCSTPLYCHVRLLKLVHNESCHGWLEQRFGRAFDEIITSRAIAIAHGLKLADEARLLLRYS